MCLEFNFLGLFGPRDVEYEDKFTFTKNNNKYVLSFNTVEFYEIAKTIADNNVELRKLKVLDANTDIIIKYFNGNPVTFKNIQTMDYNGVVSYYVEVIQAPTKFKKSFKRP
ncbi:hypothetical protein QI033_03875 [Staphylococcus saprophyticus]|nr:hypothetical protein [Staphylococcus saprophyticus]